MSTRSFVYDFMSLPYHEQIGLVHKMGYEGTPGPEQTDVDFFSDAMTVLKARGKIEELKAEVEALTEHRKIEGWDNRPPRPAAPPAPQGSGEHKLVASPAFAYSLAMFLTRNGQRGNAPEMQAEIETFMKDSHRSE